MAYKNIFNFATKELSQDAFLRWLIENIHSDQEGLSMISKELLSRFLSITIESPHHVTDLETHGQKHHVDILITCRVNGQSYLIAIEDKTYTWVHDNQLMRYKNEIEKHYPSFKKIYIFYKTSLLSKDNQVYVEKSGWRVFDIRKIYKIFNAFDKCGHQLLDDYMKHIRELHSKFLGDLSDDISTWDMNHWINFSINHAIDLPEDIEFAYGRFQNKYTYLQCIIKGRWKELPYLEIQSRDFYWRDNHVRFRLLLHSADPKCIEANRHMWRAHIENSDLFTYQANPKQMAVSKSWVHIRSLEELKEKMLVYVKAYKEIFEKI